MTTTNESALEPGFIPNLLTSRGTLRPGAYALRVVLIIAAALGLCWLYWHFIAGIGVGPTEEGVAHAAVFKPLAYFLMIVTGCFTAGTLIVQVIRRLRDAGCQPFWSVLVVVPAINILALLVWAVLPGGKAGAVDNG